MFLKIKVLQNSRIELSLIKNAIVVGSMDKNDESLFKINENCDRTVI